MGHCTQVRYTTHLQKHRDHLCAFLLVPQVHHLVVKKYMRSCMEACQTKGSYLACTGYRGFLNLRKRFCSLVQQCH